MTNMKRAGGMINITSTFNRLIRSEGGVSMVLTGLALVMLVVAIGAAIDFTRILTARSHAATALDAALLGASNIATSDAEIADLQQRAEEYFDANYRKTTGKRYVGASTTPITIDFDRDNGRLSGFTDLNVPLAFGEFLGLSNVTTPISAQVTRRLGINMEISLVLDYTFSMCDPSCTNKFDVMTDSVGILINELEKAVEASNSSAVDTHVSMAFVPFGHGVKINSANNLKTIFGAGENAKTDTLSDPSYYSNLPVVRGLTTDLDSIRNIVRGSKVTDAGGTNTASGIITGWKILRQQNNGEFSGTSAHRNTSIAPLPLRDIEEGKVLKRMILLSDGATLYWFYDGADSRTPYFDDYADAQARQACDRAREEGIVIDAISLTKPADLFAKEAGELMDHCAYDASHYYEVTAGNPEELRDAFRSIANSLIDKLITK